MTCRRFWLKAKAPPKALWMEHPAVLAHNGVCLRLTWCIVQMLISIVVMYTICWTPSIDHRIRLR
uniref:Uncharacterized protein n=1 Tax=Ascaris lumbricoides TaxID=6252 RepID=A0A9J2Q375_ASCLU